MHYLYFGDLYATPDGAVPAPLMPDHLHLSPEGYRRWADSLQPVWAELLR